MSVRDTLESIHDAPCAPDVFEKADTELEHEGDIAKLKNVRAFFRRSTRKSPPWTTFPKQSLR